VFLAIVNSTIANSNAGVNVASRTAYAMGRIGAFPRFFASVSRQHRAPVAGIVTTFVLTVAVTLGLGLGYGPENAFAMTGTGLVIILVAVYILVNAACIGYFAAAARHHGHHWNPLMHLVIPLLGIAVFVPAWLTSAGIRVFSFVAPLTAPSSYMGPGVAGWMLAGVVYLAYLYARHPQRVLEVGLVHLDDVPEE
jgi:amino acid transporter